MTLTLTRPVARETALHRAAVVHLGLLRRLRSRDFLLALGSSLAATFIVAYGIGRFPAIGGDEGIYTSQAWAILHGHITPYTYTYDHPFLGWAQLASVSWLVQAVHLGGPLTVVNLRAVMVLYCLATLLLTYGIARRLGMRPAFSVLAVLLLGLSPLFILDARQVFLDNIALPWVLGALYGALNPRGKQWTYGLAGVLMAVGILSKETVALLLPAVFYLVWTRAYRPIRAMAVAAFVTFGTVAVTVYPLFALLRSELFPGTTHVSLWTNGIMYQLATRKGSGSLWQSGSARDDLLHGWLYYDHWLVYGGAAAALVCLGIRRVRVIGLAYLLWALPVIKPGGYLPAMYIITSLPFAALAMSSVADAGFTALQAGCRRIRANALVAVGLAAVLLVAGLRLVSTDYLHGDRKVTTGANAVTPQAQALAYLKARAEPGEDILTDPAFWTDLAGYGQPWHGAVSYYQFDLDPQSSHKYLPHGWQQLNYVLETKAMADNIGNLGLSNTKLAIQHSTVIASFGTGDGLVQIRQVTPTAYNTHGE